MSQQPEMPDRLHPGQAMTTGDAHHHDQHLHSDSQTSESEPLSPTTEFHDYAARSKEKTSSSGHGHSRSRSSHLPEIHEHLKHHHHRMQTNLEQAPVDSRRPVKYLFKRPMARFLEHDGKVYKARDNGTVELANPSFSGSPDPHSHAGEAVDHIHIQRERLDLFVDLLWVGIISELSEIFFLGAFKEDADVSSVFAEFLLLFLPSWSFWFRMQHWLNLYYMDDNAQRLLIIWLMVLALIWGNNTHIFLTTELPQTWLVVTYIVGIASMKIMEGFYCISIPWIRRQFVVELLLWIPAATLWILAACYRDLHLRYAFISAGVSYEYVVGNLINSPLGSALVGSSAHKGQDRSHIISRYGSFFILALGEGVFLLIRQHPLGSGLTSTVGAGVQALVIYFLISLTYFRGDNSKRFIHAQNRSWYLQNLWMLFHIPLFCALVLLSSGILYLVKFELEGHPYYAESAPEAVVERSLNKRAGSVAADSVTYDHVTFQVAYRTIYVALAAVYASMTGLALVNRNQDRPRELIVTNRYLRLVPRLIGVGVFAGVWAVDFELPAVVIGWALLVCWLIFMAESIMGMERWPSWYEPRISWPELPGRAQMSRSHLSDSGE